MYDPQFLEAIRPSMPVVLKPINGRRAVVMFLRSSLMVSGEWQSDQFEHISELGNSFKPSIVTSISNRRNTHGESIRTPQTLSES